MTDEESKFKKTYRVITGRKGLIGIIVAIVFLWWLIPELGVVSTFRFPRITSVITEMFRDAYLIQAQVTLAEVFIGFALGVSAGVVVGTLAAYSERAKRALAPISLFFASIKKSTLAPIFVLWVGYGILPLVLVAALICFFPVLICTLDGLTLVESNYLEMMRSIQASRWHIYKKLRFPNALPKIFDGLKISAALAVVGAVVGEFLIGLSGIGTMLQVGTWMAQSRIVYASVIWMAILGISLYVIVLIVERILLPPPLRRKEI